MSVAETIRLSDPKICESTISVRNSGLITVQHEIDPDGNLVINSFKQHMPFKVERVYWRYETRPGMQFGEHAHLKNDQVIFSIGGSFDLLLDDGQNRQSIAMDVRHIGVRLGPMLFHTMNNFTPGANVLVFASEEYNEADYIRDYQEFLRLAKR